jgi:hypothetical protein
MTLLVAWVVFPLVLAAVTLRLVENEENQPVP